MRALKTNSEHLVEMEPAAVIAAREIVETEVEKLSDWEKQHVFLVGSLGEEWAVFDWCAPGKTEKVVRYLVRAAVNRKTNEVVVEANPQRAITPNRSGSLIALTIVSPMVFAACLTLLRVLFDVSGPGTWPSLNVLAGYFLIGWPICQIGVLLIVRQTLHTSAPIRLPDGTVTRVDRIWLRKT